VEKEEDRGRETAKDTHTFSRFFFISDTDFLHCDFVLLLAVIRHKYQSKLVADGEGS
jgi:hypothetical protein